jgi:hypothetical protein
LEALQTYSISCRHQHFAFGLEYICCLVLADTIQEVPVAGIPKNVENNLAASSFLVCASHFALQ